MYNLNLKNKVVLVVGGSSGIGFETAMAFKKQDAIVIATASNEKSMFEARKKFNEQVDVVQVDISNLSEIRNLFEVVSHKYKKIDVLFISSGVALQAPTSQVSEEFYDKHFDINVKGIFFTVSTALPYLNKGSSVILTSSVMGLKGIPNTSVYSATKSAVRSFVRCWTAEIPVEEVRFNVISPGPIDTPMHSKLDMTPEQLKGYIDGISQIVPAKRFGTAGEVSNLVLFLASEQSKYIAGADIAIDGGFAQI